MNLSLYELSTLVIPVIVAITFHEVAHGFVARHFGDDTAWRMGRLTLNPLRHVDPFGTIILPVILKFSTGFMFGYAKPVPVNFAALRNPRRDMVWVAAAGPATNLILATAAAVLLHFVDLLPRAPGDWLAQNLVNAIFINIILAVFNMIPLPPLDGGRVAIGILPNAIARPLARLERQGMLILIGILVILPMLGHQLGRDWDLLPQLLVGPVDWLAETLLRLTGNS